jgi:hypothetical protein
MSSSVRIPAAVFGCLLFVLGCGGGGGNQPKLAPVKGIVTYNGAPIAGAVVTFMPDKGPLAIGLTDMSGEFKLNSGSLAGCAVGPAKVSVRVDPPDPSAAPAVASSSTGDKLADMTINMQKGASNKQRSLIPEKYRDMNTSFLSFTVDPSGSKNDFKIELKD